MECIRMDCRVKRLAALRAAMRERKMDYYVIPTADYHDSEYVGDYFKIREWYSGFTGSNGTLLVGKDTAGLWTDGRYFVQAKKELTGSGIQLFQMGEEGVPTIFEYIRANGKKNVRIGFDGRILRKNYVQRLLKICEELSPELCYEEDLAGDLWSDRPGLSATPVFFMEEKYCGMTVAKKWSLIREKMKEEGADFLFVSKLDDIMWFLNIRGNDVACNPVALSYLYILQDELHLFIQKEAVSKSMEEYFFKNQIRIHEYGDVFTYLKENTKGLSGIADENETGYLASILISKEAAILKATNPIEEMKAVKTKEELEHIRHFYLLDSVAVCKYLYRMQQNGVGMDEWSASKIMDDLRREIPGFKGLSFETICAYGENAAMMHYEAKKESAATIQNENFLLLDSGGQYLGATTDVTRTIAMGCLTKEQKRDFTLVAAGMLRLQNAVFLSGCTGRNLDILARLPLWERGMDYKCGTGHGVGYFLNVHEGPHSIRWKYLPGAFETVLKPGMLVTDEPGVYKEGKYGIRTENVLLVKEKEKNADGSFLAFEVLTFVPIDLRAIDTEYLEKSDIEKLNTYHAMVYEKISPYLDEKEAGWLAKITAKIKE